MEGNTREIQTISNQFVRFNQPMFHFFKEEMHYVQ